jgi:hypothetical protein
MGIPVTSNFDVSAPGFIDSRSGPYTSSNAATSSIDINFRYKGLTVFVSSSTEIAEYWWRDGVNNSDLIPKTTGTEGTFLTTASNEGNGNVLTISKSDGTGYQITIDTGSSLQSFNFTASFTSETSVTVNHNLGYKYVLVQVFDNNSNQVIPSEINLVNTASATITFPEPTSGTAVVSVGGATFNNPTLPSNPANSVQYNNGGVFGGSSKFQFDGNSLDLWDPSETRHSFINNSPYFNYSEVLPKTFITSTYVEEITNQNTPIEKPIGSTFDKTIWSGVSASPWDIVFLSGSDNTWYPIVYNSASLSSRLLGIYNDNDSVIITEGYVVVAAAASSATDAPLIHGVLEPGSPVYLSGAGAGLAPFISTTRPNSPGYVVRIVGHLMYQNPTTTDYWLMHFRPDHAWVEIV